MIQTNWYVITGAPSSGKTTLINHLAGAGFTIAPEVARHYIEQFLSANHSLEDLLLNTTQLQRDILALALKRERHLNKEQLIFFDRGTADSLGYFNYYHIKVPYVTEACQHTRYKKIFYCHQLPVIFDTVRVEDEQSAKKIGDNIYLSYTQLNYQLIELPAVSVEQRVNIILSHLHEDLEL